MNLDKSHKQTAKQLGRLYKQRCLHPATVKSIWTKYNQTGTVESKWCMKGRPKAMTKMEEAELIEHCQKHRHDSAIQYKMDLEPAATRQTINRSLLNNRFRSFKTLKPLQQK